MEWRRLRSILLRSEPHPGQYRCLEVGEIKHLGIVSVALCPVITPSKAACPDRRITLVAVPFARRVRELRRDHCPRRPYQIKVRGSR